MLRSYCQNVRFLLSLHPETEVVAQSVERQFVALNVVGSIPIDLPKIKVVERRPLFFLTMDFQ